MKSKDCPLDSTKSKGMDSCSRICDLVSDSLLSYIEPRCCQLTKETEKDLLLSLSMISKKIKQLSSEDGCRFEQDFVENFVSAHSCSKNLDQHFAGEYYCLANIVTTMVSFLNIDNQFVQHVAGNILSSLSCLLTNYVNKWLEFIHMLLIIEEAAISSICSAMSLSSTMVSTVLINGSSLHCYPLTIGETFRTKNPCFDFTGFIALLQARVGKVSWLVVAALFQILRNILKSLKLENGDLEGVFTDLVISSLVKIPWDVFCGIHASESLMIHVSLGKVDLQDRHKGLNRTTGVLLGTILQVLCSLVEQDDSGDEGGGPLGELAMYSKFTNLVPQLLFSCFSKCMRQNDKGLSTYLRHKMLVLMTRLSFHNQWHFSHPASYLRLLRLYFEDLIFKTFSESNAGYAGSGNCLEGSPFLCSFNDRDTHSRHLQRLVIFLHFKCCFTLVHWKQTGQGCLCTTNTLSSTAGLQLCSETCCHMGFLELSECFARCDFLQKPVDSESFSKACGSFSLSFLQLYMEEDDILFEMLLLLLRAPFFALQEQSIATDKSFRETEGDVHYYMTGIFHPIHLFHWFLILLHYDHLVLIDYLISKDTGVQCAQYLLRCLRIICKFWFVFVEFSSCGNETDQRYLKKRKISLDTTNCGGKLVSCPISMEVKRKDFSRKEIFRKLGSIRLHSFENAKECLLSLKRTVADLHQKSLFPYNPRPLLRSLTRFEELCTQ